jgi:hypothetical protein
MADDRAPHSMPWADLERPSAVRVYDWYLGGEANYAIDREFGKRAVRSFPQIRALMRSNRNWMGRVVKSALDDGITQFLDLGTGIPTVGNIHDIVSGRLGRARGRVAYVDNEAVAVAHTQLILENESADGWAGIVQQDLRYPDRVVRQVQKEGLLDFSRPVCVLMVSVLHFLGEGDRPAEIVSGYRDHLAPGSWIAISHPAVDDADPAGAEQVRAVAESYKNTQNPIWLRDREQIASWFQGTELLEPGLVHLPDWRPQQKPSDELDLEQDVRLYFWCGVGELPRE